MKKIKNVLLVDDDDTANFINKLLLEDMEITENINVVHNGLEAINLLEKNCQNGSCPNLILLDINMPVMNGFEFLEEFEKLEIKQKISIVIVMLTTSHNPNDVERVQNFGINGFLNKPLTEEAVREVILPNF